jgi:hypothetical protein
MLRNIVSIVLLSLATLSFSAHADTAKDDPIQASQIPALVERLEREAPLDQAGRQLRSDLIAWLQATPDYTITACDIVPPLPQPTVPNGPELFAQYLFGNLSYQITHPGKLPESVLQTAGVESMLKAYAVMLARDQKARIPEFDTLIEKKASTPLDVLLAPAIAEHCDER